MKKWIISIDKNPKIRILCRMEKGGDQTKTGGKRECYGGERRRRNVKINYCIV